MSNRIQRGTIYYADLNPVIGSEQGGLRPVLIVQNNTGNIKSPTVIVAALSKHANAKPVLPTHYVVGTYCGLIEVSVVLLEQLRTIDKKRLIYFIGRLDAEDMAQIDRRLAISLELKKI